MLEITNKQMSYNGHYFRLPIWRWEFDSLHLLTVLIAGYKPRTFTLNRRDIHKMVKPESFRKRIQAGSRG